MKKLNHQAFAPVEVLVVVLILIVVAFIGFSAYQRVNNSNQTSLTNPEANAAGYKTLAYAQPLGAIVQGCRAGSTVNSGVKIRMKGVTVRGNSPTNTSAYIVLRSSSPPWRRLSAEKYLYPNSSGSWSYLSRPLKPTSRLQNNANPGVVAALQGHDSSGAYRLFPTNSVRYQSMPRC